MENNLVVLKGQEILCDSRVVADKFGKKHAYAADVIKKLISDFKGQPTRPLCREKLSEYKGQEYTYYEMDKKFFTHLAMRFKGKKAFEWQIKFIDAFFQMEQELLKRSNLEWKTNRNQGKQIHLNLTDEIKLFIEYAKKQGGTPTGCDRYYSNITKMEYVALGFIEQNEKVSKDFRNTLDLMELNHLIAAECVARKAIMEGMAQELHYKDIFQLAKIEATKLADIMVIKTILYRKEVK